MPAEKQDTKPEQTSLEEPKKEIMGIERDDKNCRISFTPDGGVVIITMPIGHMPRVVAHGFIHELHDMVNAWFAERVAARKNTEIITRDNISRFSFKNGLSKILGRR